MKPTPDKIGIATLALTVALCFIAYVAGWLWVALAVLTLVLFAYVARHLWRRWRTLARELASAGMIAGEHLDSSDHEPWASPGPTMYDDDIELRARVARLRARRDTRRSARTARHHRRWRHWAADSQ